MLMWFQYVRVTLLCSSQMYCSHKRLKLVLNPCQKGAYFKKYWSSTLETEALTSMEDVVLVFINAPDLIPISI